MCWVKYAKISFLELLFSRNLSCNSTYNNTEEMFRKARKETRTAYTNVLTVPTAFASLKYKEF